MYVCSKSRKDALSLRAELYFLGGGGHFICMKSTTKFLPYVFQEFFRSSLLHTFKEMSRNFLVIRRNRAETPEDIDPRSMAR